VSRFDSSTDCRWDIAAGLRPCGNSIVYEGPQILFSDHDCSFRAFLNSLSEAPDSGDDFFAAKTGTS